MITAFPFRGIGAGVADLTPARLRKAALEQEQLAKCEAQLRQIVDAIPQMITVWIAHGHTSYANRTMLDYTGLTIAEAMGVDFRSRAFHPEDIARTSSERKKALLGVAPFAMEERVLRKDGEYR